MSRARTAIVIAGVAFALVAFAWIARQLSLVSIGLAAHQEVESQLKRSLDDQKKLARLDPAAANAYRRRFDSIAALLRHLRILRFNRQALTRNIDYVLIAAVALILAAGLLLYVLERRRREQRLVRLENAVAALSRGEGEIVIGEHRRDVIGRIASAIESSSRAAVHDRRRLRYLENLSAWQEAARRHAHEIRTPLAAARMEIERFTGRMRSRYPEAAEEIDAARTSMLEEIDQLRDFTRSFTSFATIPPPRLQPIDLTEFLGSFASTFATAWPNAHLRFERHDGSVAIVNADAEMLRQVMVNLASNASQAFGPKSGSVDVRLSRHENVYHVDVADDGPGVSPSIRPRLFEPYATTRGVGEGIGLGLAISRKIMIDHGGDLDLLDGTAGAVFRLTLPAPEAEP